MDKLQSIFQLRDVLRGLERDVGIDKLSITERDIFLAAYSLTSAPGDVIQSQQIRTHHLVENVPQATFHRALKSLLSQGFLARSDESKAKTYIIGINSTKK